MKGMEAGKQFPTRSPSMMRLARHYTTVKRIEPIPEYYDIPFNEASRKWKSSYNIGSTGKQRSQSPPALPAARISKGQFPPDLSSWVSVDVKNPHVYEDESDSGKECDEMKAHDQDEMYSKRKMGWLQQLSRKNKGSKYWCSITEDVFSIAEDKNRIPFDNIYSSAILTVVSKNVSASNTQLHCFGIVDTLANKVQPREHTFAASNIRERDEWVYSLWMCITPSTRVAHFLNSDQGKAGRFDYKETVCGIWQLAWLKLSHRNLILWLDAGATRINIDLRKVTSLSLLDHDPDVDSAAVEFKGKLFHLAYNGKTVYLRSVATSETEDTFKSIVVARNATGNEIEDQFLTQNDVPVLVERCLSYISAYGLKIKGIYKHDVKQTRVDTLLHQLQTDPFSINLFKHYFTVHEIASALKYFFSKFVKPLSNELVDSWHNACDAKRRDRHIIIGNAISRLPRIRYQTLRRLILHFWSVIQCQEFNAVSEANIIDMFGPILIGDSIETFLGKEILTCLLNNFQTIFQVSKAELDKEREILKLTHETKDNIWRTVNVADTGVVVSIYVDDRNWGRCLPFTVYPKMKARDVCAEITSLINRPVKLESVVLCEVVCNGELERPIHFTQLVFEVLFRWRNWDRKESAKNYLLFKNDNIYSQITDCHSTLTSGEVSLADARTKVFKKVWLKLDNAKQPIISYFQDQKAAKASASWRIMDVTWYIGCESRRHAPSKSAFTFIERIVAVKRTKVRPYFGTTVSVENEEQLYKWFAAMLKAEYPMGNNPS